MNKYKILFCLSLLLSTLGLFAESTYFQTITPAVTTVAGTTTNSTAGSTLMLFAPERRVRIYATCSGIASTTNGSLVVKFITASGDVHTTNSFDTATMSNIKLTFTQVGNTTVQVSDVFDLSGVRYLTTGAIENTFQGPVSNLVFRLSYVSGEGTR